MSEKSHLHLPDDSAATRRVALGVFVGAIVLLYLLMPFTYGHGFERKSLATVVYKIADELEDWHHVLYVPIISIFLVYLRRDLLASVPIRGSLAGLGIVIFSLALYWLGYKAETHYIGFAAIQLLIAGIIIWFLGWRFFGLVFFPWLFLVFAWPLVFLDDWIALPLRLRMSELSFFFLNLIGLDTIQQGTAILSAPDPARDLGAGEVFSVDIADPCSGIRSLFALMMLCALYGYFAMPRIWQHGIIFVAAIPLAILGNFVRILLLTFGILFFGSDFAIGPDEDHPSTYHMAAGYAVFAVAIVGMIAIGKLLLWLDPGPPKKDAPNPNRRDARTAS